MTVCPYLFLVLSVALVVLLLLLLLWRWWGLARQLVELQVVQKGLALVKHWGQRGDNMKQYKIRWGSPVGNRPSLC